DAVYVTTPIPSHFPIARIIYSKEVSRNLFIEKTLGSSYDEARELCELAHHYRGVNMVGYMRRFAVTFRKVKELLSNDAIGEVLFFKAYAYSSDFSGIKDKLGIHPSEVGVIRDLGCHALDLALWLFGDLQVESAKLESLVGSSAEDSAYFRVKNSRQLEGEFSVSWCIENYRVPEVGFSIDGEKGVLEVNDDKLQLKLKGKKMLTWYRHDLHDNVTFWLGGPEFFREDEHFVKSVIAGRNAEPSFETASKVDKIIDDIRKRAGANE
ncbi:MAG: Gfo/Idh/MocA family oxidoreductase, partial [Candidatus Jordarchaeaceae archaeon]